MSVRVFENSYWYALELKAFAKEIGIPSYDRLRKDELESAIKSFLTNGKHDKPTLRVSRNKSAAKDYSLSPLTPNTLITNYTSNKTTKSFIVAEAKHRQSSFEKKSGCWYWLNRWREDQFTAARRITYGDLVEQFLVLCNTKERLPKIPSTKFNNFISDFIGADAGNRTEAAAAWEALKYLDCPKTFNDWLKHKP